jgi:hypothetical protein
VDWARPGPPPGRAGLGMETGRERLGIGDLTVSGLGRPPARQVECVPPPCLQMVQPAWTWAEGVLRLTVGSLSAALNGGPPPSTHPSPRPPHGPRGANAADPVTL